MNKKPKTSFSSLGITLSPGVSEVDKKMKSTTISQILIFVLIILFSNHYITHVNAEEYETKQQGMGPTTIALTEDGNYAYVGFHLSETILRINLEDFTIEAACDLSALFPLKCYYTVLDVKEEKLFVYSRSWQKLIVLDTHTMSVIHTIENIGATGIIRSQYGPFLIIWNDSNTVTFVNTETYHVTELTDNSIGFVQIQESKTDQDLWYITTNTQGTWVVGLYNHKIKEWKDLIPLSPQDGLFFVTDLKVLPNEQKAYVAVWGGHYEDEPTHAFGWLYSVDFVEREVNVIPIDGSIWCLEMSPDGKWIYIGADWPKPTTENNIQVVSTQSDTVVDYINLDMLPRDQFTEVRDLQSNPANSQVLYAVSNDANALIKIDLNTLTLVNTLVFNDQSLYPHFLVKKPNEPTGYILIHTSANIYELDLDKGTIERVIELPNLRDDAGMFDIAIDNKGRMLVAQGEHILELDADNFRLLESHELSDDLSGLWRFILSNDETKLYAVWDDPEEAIQNTFLAVDSATFQVEARIKLEGGVFNSKPFELPDGSKLYALGGWDWSDIVIHIIETHGFTIEKTITYDPPGPLGISAGPYYPFAYDSRTKNLFFGAGSVILVMDTDTDTITQIIDLEDSARAIGLEPGHFHTVNAMALVYQPEENYLYIAHLDQAYVSIYDLTNDQFLSQVIPLQGFFPYYAVANDDYSKIYYVMDYSDSISVIDVRTKTVEKVINLHDYSPDTLTSEPEPEPEPELPETQRDIPGFTPVSIMMGVIVGIILLRLQNLLAR